MLISDKLCVCPHARAPRYGERVSWTLLPRPHSERLFGAMHQIWVSRRPMTQHSVLYAFDYAPRGTRLTCPQVAQVMDQRLAVRPPHSPSPAPLR